MRQHVVKAVRGAGLATGRCCASDHVFATTVRDALVAADPRFAGLAHVAPATLATAFTPATLRAALNHDVPLAPWIEPRLPDVPDVDSDDNFTAGRALRDRSVVKPVVHTALQLAELRHGLGVRATANIAAGTLLAWVPLCHAISCAGAPLRVAAAAESPLALVTHELLAHSEAGLRVAHSSATDDNGASPVDDDPAALAGRRWLAECLLARRPNPATPNAPLFNVADAAPHQRGDHDPVARAALDPSRRAATRLSADAAWDRMIAALYGGAPLAASRDDFVAAASMVLSHGHSLPAPWHHGILPVVYRMNHGCAANAALLVGVKPSDRQRDDDDDDDDVTGGDRVALPQPGSDAVSGWGAVESAAAAPSEADVAPWVATPAVNVLALKDIAAGDEVTLSYHSPSDVPAVQIAERFVDVWGFVPDVTDPIAVNAQLSAQHTATRNLVTARMERVAALVERV